MPLHSTHAPAPGTPTAAPAPAWAREVTAEGPAGGPGPAQLALFLPDELEPAPVARTRLPGRIKSLLTRSPRKANKPGVDAAGGEESGSHGSLWPDSFFDQ
jgi:hypothetical protein